MRPFKRIKYDKDFQRDTLPTTPLETAKVQHNGVKIKYIYYYCDAFRTPGVEGTRVLVRYDPFDVGQAYAFVNGQWTLCVSEYKAVFAGRSEREIDIATKILRKRNQNSTKHYTVTSSLIAGFLGSLEAEEALLMQRMHDIEAKEILAYVNNSQEPVGDSMQAESQVYEDMEDVQDTDGTEDQEDEVVQTVQKNEHLYTNYEDF